MLEVFPIVPPSSLLIPDDNSLSCLDKVWLEHPSEKIASILACMLEVNVSFRLLSVIVRKRCDSPRKELYMETTTGVTEEAKRPGLLERGVRVVRQEYRAWRASHDKQEQDDLFKQHTKDDATVGAAFKHGLIATAALVVPLGCAAIAFLAAGYYFNGGQDWNGDTESLVSYGLAALVELGLLALLTASAVAFWQGKPWHFLAAGLLRCRWYMSPPARNCCI
jgi:hypothetical protein